MNNYFIDIRIKVILLTFLMPVLLSAFILLFYIFSLSGAAFYIWMIVLIEIPLTLPFKKGHYLSGFSKANGILELTYLSPFLKKNIYKISIDSIKAVQIEKANYLVSITGGLNIETASGWKCFDLVDKRLAKEIIANIT